MSKKDVMDYVFETPMNTNPTILNQKLDELIDESGGSGSVDIKSSDEVNKIKILPDRTMEINGITFDKVQNSASTSIVLYGGNAEF